MTQFPQLWILTPTLSAEKLTDFGAIKDVENWDEGVYLLPKSFKTGIRKSLIIRMLTRKLGELDANSIDLINNLNLEAIESLGDALLEFNTIDDLTAWLDKSLRGIQ